MRDRTFPSWMSSVMFVGRFEQFLTNSAAKDIPEARTKVDRCVRMDGPEASHKVSVEDDKESISALTWLSLNDVDIKKLFFGRPNRRLKS